MMQLRTPDVSSVGPAGAVPTKLKKCPSIGSVSKEELETLWTRW